MTDRQTGVFVGLDGQRAVDKQVARHLLHRGSHCVAPQAFAAQALHHSLAHQHRIQPQAERHGLSNGVLGGLV